LVYFICKTISQEFFYDEDVSVVHLEFVFEFESEWFHKVVVHPQDIVLQQANLLACQKSIGLVGIRHEGESKASDFQKFPRTCILETSWNRIEYFN
jgi:hypothetical protein